MVPKVGRRRSDGAISRFPFSGENVRRSFVVCSHDPIFRTNKESLGYHAKFVGAFHLSRRVSGGKEHVLFHPFFQNYGSVCRKVIFNVFTRSDFRNQKNRILKNGSCERVFSLSKNVKGEFNFLFYFSMSGYFLTKISIQAKHSISFVFSLFIVSSPFYVHCPFKGILTGLKPY